VLPVQRTAATCDLPFLLADMLGTFAGFATVIGYGGRFTRFLVLLCASPVPPGDLVIDCTEDVASRVRFLRLAAASAGVFVVDRVSSWAIRVDCIITASSLILWRFSSKEPIALRTD